ncbi:MAG: M23 family metallopeptidase [Spirochaetaceae bacterium]|nr:M23 family metallopeptidase [Spirochaetaceae bacterium]
MKKPAKVIDQIKQHPVRKRRVPGNPLWRGFKFHHFVPGLHLSKLFNQTVSRVRHRIRTRGLPVIVSTADYAATEHSPDAAGRINRVSVKEAANTMFGSAAKNTTGPDTGGGARLSDAGPQTFGGRAQRFAGAAQNLLAAEQLRYMIPLAATVLVFCLSLTMNRRFMDVPISPQEDSFFHGNLASYAGLPVSPESRAGEEAIPLDLMETFEWKSYTVQKGDSVSGIAVKFALSMDAIIASNGITNVKRLAAGQAIRIPNMDGIPYTVQRGDSLAKISALQGVPLEVILDANDIQQDTITEGTVLFIPGARMRKEDLKLALGDFFIYPIRGRLSSPYGWRNDPISGVRRYHAAIDLAAALGTPIKAAMDGVIATVGTNSVYGKYIIISHSNGFQTMYAHLSVVSVSQGARVNQGAKIGEVGTTGYSTGPHLHFAVYKNGRAVNPLDFLHS